MTNEDINAKQPREVDGGRNRPIMNHAIVLHFTKHENPNVAGKLQL